MQVKFTIRDHSQFTLTRFFFTVVGNVQEKAMKSYTATNSEVILYSYGIGLLYLFIFLLISGNLASGFLAFSENTFENYGLAFVFSLTGYFGANMVLSLVRSFGGKEPFLSRGSGDDRYSIHRTRGSTAPYARPK